MIVVDASVVVEVLLRTPAGIAIATRLRDGGERLHAPHVQDLEVVQVIRCLVLAGKVTSERGTEAIEDFQLLPIRRHAHERLVKRIWELRDNLTAYDAAYVALAEALGATLLTRDRKIASAAGHAARVEVV